MEIGALSQEDGYATCAAAGLDSWLDEVNTWEDPETQSFNAMDSSHEIVHLKKSLVVFIWFMIKRKTHH